MALHGGRGPVGRLATGRRLQFQLLRRLLRSTLFPYTTLFRSRPRRLRRRRPSTRNQGRGAWRRQRPGRRSEEHTSELQSRQYLVCRLLLEKKNLNTGLKLPAAAIIVAHRVDASGTPFNWSILLSKASSEWRYTVGEGLSVAWPLGVGFNFNYYVASCDQHSFPTRRSSDLALADYDDAVHRHGIKDEAHGVDSGLVGDRKSTRLNSSHANISYAVFCLKKKTSIPA